MLEEIKGVILSNIKSSARRKNSFCKAEDMSSNKRRKLEFHQKEGLSLSLNNLEDLEEFFKVGAQLNPIRIQQDGEEQDGGQNINIKNINKRESEEEPNYEESINKLDLNSNYSSIEEGNEEEIHNKVATLEYEDYEDDYPEMDLVPTIEGNQVIGKKKEKENFIYKTLFFHLQKK